MVRMRRATEVWAEHLRSSEWGDQVDKLVEDHLEHRHVHRADATITLREVAHTYGFLEHMCCLGCLDRKLADLCVGCVHRLRSLLDPLSRHAGANLLMLQGGCYDCGPFARMPQPPVSLRLPPPRAVPQPPDPDELESNLPAEGRPCSRGCEAPLVDAALPAVHQRKPDYVDSGFGAGHEAVPASPQGQGFAAGPSPPRLGSCEFTTGVGTSCCQVPVRYQPEEDVGKAAHQTFSERLLRLCCPASAAAAAVTARRKRGLAVGSSMRRIHTLEDEDWADMSDRRLDHLGKPMRLWPDANDAGADPAHVSGLRQASGQLAKQGRQGCAAVVISPRASWP